MTGVKLVGRIWPEGYNMGCSWMLGKVCPWAEEDGGGARDHSLGSQDDDAWWVWA